MFSHKHYVPILKTKEGEKWAVKMLNSSQREALTPLFEIHAHKSIDLFTHSKAMCAKLASILGSSSPMFLDTCWLHSPAGDARVIREVYSSECLQELGLYQ